MIFQVEGEMISKKAKETLRISEAISYLEISIWDTFFGGIFYADALGAGTVDVVSNETISEEEINPPLNLVHEKKIDPLQVNLSSSTFFNV